MKLKRHEALAIVVASLCFGFLFSYPILPHIGEKTLYEDFSYSLDTAWAIWTSVARYHQLPLWNPYRCGGMPLLANPQAPLPSLFLALHLIVGPFAGSLLEIPLHLSIGFAGAYFLTRVIDCRPLAALGCAIAFAGSSWFPLHASVGHEIFPQFVYLPWILAFAILCMESRRIVFGMLAGLVIAIAFGEGGIYPLLQGSIFVVVILLTEILLQRSLWPAVVAISIPLFGAGFAAIKLIPVTELMSSHPRDMYLDSETLHYTLLSIFSRQQNADGPLMLRGFWEHGAYLSPAYALLAMLGIAMSPKRAMPWLTAAVIFFVLAMGATDANSFYGLVHRLPEFSSTRGAGRYLISFVLAASLLAALGIEDLMTRGRRAHYIAASLVAAGFIDCLLVSPRVLRDPFPAIVPLLTQSPTFRQFYDSSPFNRGMLPINIANMGALNCYEAPGLDSPGSALGYNQQGYRGEQFILEPGTVDLVRWTPNELIYHVDLPAAGTLAINQNYDAGWRLMSGRGEILENNPLLTVSLPAGAQTIELRYLPRSFLIGSIISLLTCVAVIGVWNWEGKRKRSAQPTIADSGQE
jgi:hypothetical protein